MSLVGKTTIGKAFRRWLDLLRRKTGRLDIRRRSPIDQPINCALLRLPAELSLPLNAWEIFTKALEVPLTQGLGLNKALVSARPDPKALRTITGRATAWNLWPRSEFLTSHHYLVRTRYYDYSRSHNRLRDGPSKLGIPVEGINPSLFLSCRQVYLEALPILYGSNTFYFLAHEVEAIVLPALGHYYLPEIRSVYLFETTSIVPSWSGVFSVLQQMRLTTLAMCIRLDQIGRSEGRDDPLRAFWGRGMLGIRNLAVFELLLFAGDVDQPAQQELIERCRELMMGPEADEKYRKFLLENQRKLTP
ncbi:hypothetical protein C8F04DRAFT_1390810 [Mycena alexandri]|uniref:DUF7730 domain-containing protein n=1 Tax=Mycena alexandri TaxID=1745969 RepID=A0AAD6T8Y7_9AGAR|nr:hypothetical protein C8F04DRAFT_1390810 [Mycena alexandri]